MDNQKDNCDGEFGNVNNISDEVNFSSGFNTYKKAGGESMDSDHCRESEGSRKGGSILMLMDELVKEWMVFSDEYVVFKYPSYSLAKSGYNPFGEAFSQGVETLKIKKLDLGSFSSCSKNGVNKTVGQIDDAITKVLFWCHTPDRWYGTLDGFR
ncbi:hypothetical protein Tco_0598986 [Tanacetum coccineum]